MARIVTQAMITHSIISLRKTVADMSRTICILSLAGQPPPVDYELKLARRRMMLEQVEEEYKKNEEFWEKAIEAVGKKSN